MHGVTMKTNVHFETIMWS